jgi:hypothetical protein
MKRHVLFVSHMQALKWRLQRRSHELAATDAERKLNCFHTHIRRNRDEERKEAYNEYNTVSSLVQEPKEYEFLTCDLGHIYVGLKRSKVVPV